LGKRGRFSKVSERENAKGAGQPESGGQVSPADKPLKTPAREPPNERKGASGLLEAVIEMKYSPGVMETEGAWRSFPRSRSHGLVISRG